VSGFDDLLGILLIVSACALGTRTAQHSK